MKTATFVRTLNGAGVGKVYKVSPPVSFGDGATSEYVWVSAVNLPVALLPDFGSETMIFASDAEGQVLDWLEIDCTRNTLDHAEALSNAGYEVVS